MLLKAVLIVCVVRKERKEELLRRRARVLFPFGGLTGREKTLSLRERSVVASCPIRTFRVLTFFALEAPKVGVGSYDAS